MLFIETEQVLLTLKVYMMSADTPPKVVRRQNSINGLKVVGPPTTAAPGETVGKSPDDGERYRVKEFSEKWCQKAELLLQTCPSHDDLTYIQHFLDRLEFGKFHTDSQALSKMRASKAQRAEQAGKRRMRRLHRSSI